jgi:phosphoribosylanthranilate isomerase
MTCHVKICGLSTLEAVEAAVKGGASHIGFVFFAPSPRNITAVDAAVLAEPARARGVKVVAVMVDPDDAALSTVVGALKPDFVQLHGGEPPTRAAEVRSHFGVGVIKALAVADADDIEAARAFEDAVDHVMFDAKPPAGAKLPGGNGARFDWRLLQGVRLRRPWFLAGGVDPWNVGSAITQSGAQLIDVSSGVERGAGIKDPVLIHAFLTAASKV